MSASSTPTRSPLAFMPSARLAATVDLPTPPLPEATATMARTPGASAVLAAATAGRAAGRGAAPPRAPPPLDNTPARPLYRQHPAPALGASGPATPLSRRALAAAEGFGA